MKKLLLLIACLLLFAAPALAASGDGDSDPASPSDPSPQSESGCGTCLPSELAGILERLSIKSQAEGERKHITADFTAYESWLVGTFFNQYVLTGMKGMAQALTVAGMQQVEAFGTLLDGKQQMEVQRSLGNLMADAHARYQTSTDMCVIGTAAIGMGAAERNGEAVAQGLASHAQNRQLGNIDTASSDGPAADRASRLAAFKNRHCDAAANNGGFANICNNTPAEGVNRDVDYTRTIERAESLNMDFDGQSYGGQDISTHQPATVTSAPNDQDVVALESNLFGHDLFTRQSTSIFENANTADSYLDARSVLAKRSVAENSFFAIAGMKSAGSEASETTAPYIQAVFQQLGASPADAKTLIGVRPSYYSLLDSMARRIYQNPQFFTNLYDTPANVERKDVAMQAIGLMLDRDQYKSELRSEADLAVLLELELGPAYQRVQSRISWLSKKQ